MISEKVKVSSSGVYKLDCDGIVNAANRSLLRGSGVDEGTSTGRQAKNYS